MARRATATSCSGTVQTAGPRLSAGPSCWVPVHLLGRAMDFGASGPTGKFTFLALGNWFGYADLFWSSFVCPPAQLCVRVCRNFWTAKPNPHVLSFNMGQWERHPFSTLPRWFPLSMGCCFQRAQLVPVVNVFLGCSLFWNSFKTENYRKSLGKLDGWELYRRMSELSGIHLQSSTVIRRRIVPQEQKLQEQREQEQRLQEPRGFIGSQTVEFCDNKLASTIPC